MLLARRQLPAQLPADAGREAARLLEPQVEVEAEAEHAAAAAAVEGDLARPLVDAGPGPRAVLLGEAGLAVEREQRVGAHDARVEADQIGAAHQREPMRGAEVLARRPRRGQIEERVVALEREAAHARTAGDGDAERGVRAVVVVEAADRAAQAQVAAGGVVGRVRALGPLLRRVTLDVGVVRPGLPAVGGLGAGRRLRRCRHDPGQGLVERGPGLVGVERLEGLCVVGPGRAGECESQPQCRAQPDPHAAGIRDHGRPPRRFTAIVQSSCHQVTRPGAGAATKIVISPRAGRSA